MKEITLNDLTGQLGTVERAAAGDQSAFATLVADHGPQMARVAFVICGDADATRDAVQNAWSLAWRRLRTPPVHTGSPVASTLPIASQSPVTGQSPPAPSTAKVLAPICDARAELTTDPKPGDGAPDPDGRIVFGRILRDDVVKGPIVTLYGIDPDGTDLTDFLNCEVTRPRYSPDGTRIAFGIVMADQSFQVATISADGSDLRILTSTAGYAETPDWSPDGSWLVYSHAPEACVDFEKCVLDGNIWNLWRMNADGSNQQRIGNADTFDWEPRISPDGREVVFQRLDYTIADPDDWTMKLWIRDLDTGVERLVSANDERPLEHPEWSEDGRWIVYNPTGCGPCEQIELMPVDEPTAEPRVLYAGDALHSGFKPFYSPDGTRIAFGCRLGLCSMDTDGSNVELIVATAGGGEVNHFDWGVLPRP